MLSPNSSNEIYFLVSALASKMGRTKNGTLLPTYTNFSLYLKVEAFETFKSGSISERFALWLKFPKQCQITILSIFSLQVDSAQDLAPIFGDLYQSEKLSEIKPPLILCIKCHVSEYVAKKSAAQSPAQKRKKGKSSHTT